MAPLRLGIIGLGAAGAGIVPALASHGRVVLAGAADPDARLTANLARDFAVPVEADARALLARTDIDAVYIATPHQMHCEHAVMALEAGKHVVVEKPMALTLEECDRMILAAEAARRVLLVGHTHAYDAPIAVMRALIAGGSTGRVSMVSTWNYTDFLYRPRRPEELDTTQGGGILFNQVPHQIDTVRFLVGAPVTRVRAATGRLDARRPTEGNCMVWLEFADGATASLVYSGYDRFDSDEMHGWIGERGQPKKPNHGAARRFIADLDAREEARLKRERFGYGLAASGGLAPASGSFHQPHFGILVVSCERADLRPSADGVLVYDDSGVREIAITQGAGLAGRDRVLDELVAAVQDGVAPEHDGRFARGTVAVMLAVQESARERCEVVLGAEV